MQPRTFQSEKHGGNSDTTTNVPSIEMYLSLACTQCPSSPFSLIISLMRLCLPPALTHRGTTVKLGVHFEWYTGAPVRHLSLGTPTKQRGWRYQNAARMLSARIGPGRPSGQLAGGCVPVPGSHAAPSLLGHLLYAGETVWSLSAAAS